MQSKAKEPKQSKGKQANIDAWDLNNNEHGSSLEENETMFVHSLVSILLMRRMNSPVMSSRQDSKRSILGTCGSSDLTMRKSKVRFQSFKGRFLGERMVQRFPLQEIPITHPIPSQNEKIGGAVFYRK